MTFFANNPDPHCTSFFHFDTDLGKGAGVAEKFSIPGKLQIHRCTFPAMPLGLLRNEPEKMHENRYQQGQRGRRFDAFFCMRRWYARSASNTGPRL